jgi:hypothetical protein
MEAPSTAGKLGRYRKFATSAQTIHLQIKKSATFAVCATRASDSGGLEILLESVYTFTQHVKQVLHLGFG